MLNMQSTEFNGIFSIDFNEPTIPVFILNGTSVFQLQNDPPHVLDFYNFILNNIIIHP